MTQAYSFWKKNIDLFLLLLISFAVILSSLFIYLKSIDKNVQNYSTYQQKLQNMIALDLTLDNIFLKTFRYIDNDLIVKTSQTFEKDIRLIEQSSFREEFGQGSYDKLLNIDELFHKKMDLIVHFQSANARATNAIHYLFDLRKTIEEKYPDNQSAHILLNSVFFELGRVLMGLPLSTITVDEELMQIENYKTVDKFFGYFYRQTKLFLADAELINVKLSSNQKIHLHDAVKILLSDLSQQYERNIYQQKLITMSFFVLAFLILIILFFNYRRVKQTSLELKAFRYAVENSDNAIVITNAERKIQYANETFELHTGYKIEEVMGENPNVLKSNLHSDDFYREMNETLDRGEKWQGELINKRKDGALLYEKASIVPIIVNGELVQYLAIKLDITEYIETQQKMQQSAVAFETIGEGILITDEERKIISVNPAFIKMFGYTAEELIGKEPTVVSSSEDHTLFYQKLRKTLASKDRWSGRVEGITKSGMLIPVWLTITVVRDEEGNIQNSIVIYTSLQEIIEMEERVDFLAYHDDLTKLPNRTYIERELADIFELARLSGEKVALLFIDLDRFKVINDTLGHHIGDGMLIVLSERIKKVVGANDLLARFGGDEFVVVMNAVQEKRDAGLLAEKILAVIKKPIRVKDYHLNTTASIGIALYPDDGDEINVMIKHADGAMYHAKERGKDNYQFYTRQLSVDMHMRHDLEQKLLHAIEKNELSLVYQPQYDLKSRKVIGVEALLRWSSPELGQVPPDHFIPVAEETGMIVEIGKFVLEKASRAYMLWREEGLELSWIAVNLSSVQFRQSDLLEDFSEIIKRTGIPAENIEMEITERCMMENTEENLLILTGFKKIGCSISIDDFGTGYSSMNYLKSFSLDKIKIDKSFVDNLPSDDNNREVSMAIIALSQSLGYQVIAEGIENKAQEDFLREQGCDYGQGYYFSRPLKSEALMSFIRNR